MKCVTSVLKIVFLFKASTQSYGYATVAYPFACQWSLGFLSHPLAILNNTAMDRWRKQWQPTPVLLPGKSHGQRSLVGCSPIRSLRVGHDWATSLSHIGEGNGNPLQCSCLENPRDRGVWWAAVYGVAQGRTQLKWLSSSSYG